MKTNLKSHRKNTRLIKKQIGYSALGLRKPNFRTKIIPFEKSHNAENCKRGPFEIFSTSILLQNFKKKKGNPLQTLKNFRKSLTKPKKRESHSAEKVRTFCFGILVKKISAYARVRTRTLLVKKHASYH